MTPALIFALALAATDAQPAPSDQGGGEPLPPGAPTQPYELSAWCFGALGEYLAIYEHVKPELRDIDKMFGTSVVEDEPYQSDMAAYRIELKMLGDSVTDAEKASDRPIADRGVMAMRMGENIWSYAEAKTRRELARAWLLWSLPDKCDSNARELTARSLLLGRALKFNTNAPPPPPLPTPVSPEMAAANAASAAEPVSTMESDAAPVRTPPPGAALYERPAPPPAAQAAPIRVTPTSNAPPPSAPAPVREAPAYVAPVAASSEPPPAAAQAAPPTPQPPPTTPPTLTPPNADQSQEPTL
ncbi:MAG TPA: hypothetical protein VGL58_12455 [Caulobacteraceae bacterium]|jgi:hypothetical protein